MGARWALTLPLAPKKDAPTPNALPDALVRRFAGDVARLIGETDTGRIGIAVSGGPDSLALLLLANAAVLGRVEAATVNHQLRSESDNEALFVAEICAEHQIAHATLPVTVMLAGNISAAARTARYTALDGWADSRRINWIMTGHHADDQRETMIMRLTRGAGLAGLSGVRAKQGRILRPLLRWRHDELKSLVAETGIVAVDDPTNHDDRYDRARLRKLLQNADWIDPQALALSAEALAEANAALEWCADRLEAMHVSQDEAGVAFERAAQTMPKELVRRLALRCLRRIDPACDPRGVPLGRFIAALENGGTAMLGAVVARGGDDWHFSLAPSRRLTKPK